mmetsp:Transcript_41800/g.82536  ORF Transcript_41800/g.82536 Transcript_41800/m.82536 type:complete len:103 (+) Transcript_41800:1152-1460(+)
MEANARAVCPLACKSLAGPNNPSLPPPFSMKGLVRENGSSQTGAKRREKKARREKRNNMGTKKKGVGRDEEEWTHCDDHEISAVSLNRAEERFVHERFHPSL